MKNYRILVVDDDAIFLMLTEKFLEQINFNKYVQKFTNGKKVLDYLEENYSSDEHYIVLLDLNMPVMNGWEFLDTIKDKAFDDNLDVYIVTSSTDRSDIEKSKTYSIVKGYKSKPLGIKGLSEIKDEYLA